LDPKDGAVTEPEHKKTIDWNLLKVRPRVRRGEIPLGREGV